jgi:hypothetical protein
MPPDSRQLAVFDDRPFFERSLVYGVRKGIIDQEKIRSILDDAPKGMVQIAAYFGTQYLRPNIEQARIRIVNLVSLYLDVHSDSDLERAARSLRDHSFSFALPGRIGNAQASLGDARRRLLRHPRAARRRRRFSPSGR